MASLTNEFLLLCTVVKFRLVSLHPVADVCSFSAVWFGFPNSRLLSWLRKAVFMHELSAGVNFDSLNPKVLGNFPLLLGFGACWVLGTGTGFSAEVTLVFLREAFVMIE